MASSIYQEHLSQSQLQALMDYKYRGEDRSITYKYVMGPFYNHVVNYLPMWIAPNAVTLIGFILTASAHLLLMYYSPTLTEQAPNFVYTFAGVALFIYMILDNLDGKQARRTQSASPLGQLFDHGCDALNVTMSGMSVLAMCQLGGGILTIIVTFIVGQLMVFLATLEELHTGVMLLRELNGPNEGLLIICMMQIITGILGPQIWIESIDIPFSNGATIYWNQLMVYLSIIMGFFINGGNVFGIITHVRLAVHPKKRKDTTINILQHLSPIILFEIVYMGWAIFAPDHLRIQIVILLWISSGLTFDLITRVMLAHLAKAEYPYFQKLIIPVILCLMNSILNEQLDIEIINVNDMTYLVLIFITLYNSWRTWCLLTQLCHFLNRRCFSLRPLKADGR